MSFTPISHEENEVFNYADLYVTKKRLYYLGHTIDIKKVVSVETYTKPPIINKGILVLGIVLCIVAITLFILKLTLFGAIAAALGAIIVIAGIVKISKDKKKASSKLVINVLGISPLIIEIEREANFADLARIRSQIFYCMDKS